MKNLMTVILLLLIVKMNSALARSFESAYSFDLSEQRILNLLKEKKFKIFEIIDHSHEAREIGLTLRPTKVIVFGNPKVGTLIMEKYPKLSLQLPLKVLMIEDQKKTTITFDESILQILDQSPDEKLKMISTNIKGLVKAIENSVSQ